MLALNEKEKTLVVIRPHAVTSPINIGAIEDALADKYLEIVKRKKIFLNAEECNPYSVDHGMVRKHVLPLLEGCQNPDFG